MTWLTTPAPTRHLSLNQVVAALARSPRIEAIALIGSATGQLRPESDIDFLVVLAADAPRLGVGLTHVDGRLADVVFARADALAALAAALRAGAPLDPDQSRLAAWLAEGRVLHDRSGLAAEVAAGARETPRQHAAPSPADRHALWFSANFNLLHTERMLDSADPLYHEAIEVRFLYQLLDLFFGYFRLRGLEALGEKHALRHLAEHDPAYLDLFQRCLHEPDRARRVALYRELAEATVAPVGTLWPPGTTALTVDDATPERLADAHAFWNGLFDP